MTVMGEFRELLETAIEKAGGKGLLAKAINVRNQTISAWCQGASPRLENLESLTVFVRGRAKHGSKNK